MPTEFIITAPEIGTAGTREQERIGRSRSAWTNADTAFVVLQFIIDIFPLSTCTVSHFFIEQVVRATVVQIPIAPTLQ